MVTHSDEVAAGSERIIHLRDGLVERVDAPGHVTATVGR